MDRTQLAEICTALYPSHLYKTENKESSRVRLYSTAGAPAHAPAAVTPAGIKLYSAEYFAYCGIGGILSCGLTHTAVTPLDLVKCNAQANPEHFKGTIQGFRAIVSGSVAHLGFRSGLPGLAKGWGPTLVGYSIQGLFKFGLYELFKHEISEMVGHDNATRYRISST
jgi:solute carrier family 25 phosphate transporter 3